MNRGSRNTGAPHSERTRSQSAKSTSEMESKTRHAQVMRHRLSRNNTAPNAQCRSPSRIGPSPRSRPGLMMSSLHWIGQSCVCGDVGEVQATYWSSDDRVSGRLGLRRRFTSARCRSRHARDLHDGIVRNNVSVLVLASFRSRVPYQESNCCSFSIALLRAWSNCHDSRKLLSLERKQILTCSGKSM